jgi:hypothetical protein
MLLKKKKMYSKQVESLMGQSFTIDSIAFTKENIQNTIEMVCLLVHHLIISRDRL